MILQELLKKSITELKKSGIKSTEIDVRVLLKHVLNKDDAFILSHPEYSLTTKEYSVLRNYIRRRKNHEPIAYITGQKEFFGLNFLVNKNVLIPRPETEELVEKAITWLKAKNLKHEDKINVIDIGTGSGNIIISVVKNILNTKYKILNTNFYATDVSKQAIEIAKKNATSHNVGNKIKFYNSNLFSNKLLPKKFDLILANLPYVPMSDFKKAVENTEEVTFEPQNAIYATDNGAEVIKKLLDEAKNRLKNGGAVILELDPRNAKNLKIYAQKLFANSYTVEIEKDLSGRDRFLTVSSTTLPNSKI